MSDNKHTDQTVSFLRSKLADLAIVLRSSGKHDRADEINNIFKTAAEPLSNQDRDTIDRLLFESVSRVREYFLNNKVDGEKLNLGMARSRSSEELPNTHYLTIYNPIKKDNSTFAIIPFATVGSGGYTSAKILFDNKEIGQFPLNKESKETSAASPAVLKPIADKLFSLVKTFKEYKKQKSSEPELELDKGPHAS